MYAANVALSSSSLLPPVCPKSTRRQGAASLPISHIGAKVDSPSLLTNRRNLYFQVLIWHQEPRGDAQPKRLFCLDAAPTPPDRPNIGSQDEHRRKDEQLASRKVPPGTLRGTAAENAQYRRACRPDTLPSRSEESAVIEPDLLQSRPQSAGAKCCTALGANTRLPFLSRYCESRSWSSRTLRTMPVPMPRKRKTSCTVDCSIGQQDLTRATWIVCTPSAPTRTAPASSSRRSWRTPWSAKMW